MSISASFSNHITGICHRIMAIPRRQYHRQKAKRNKNYSPTIVCNNCTGGVMLHDLGLRFNTPTINTLFYSFDDFFFFCLHIKELQHVELQKEETNEFKYPIASLFFNERKIRIGLVHYKSFEEGKMIWEKRFKRVNLNNIFFIYESPNVTECDAISFFQKYPHNGMIISKKNEALTYKNYFGEDFYDNWYPGKILDFRNLFSRKRFLDNIDYISFLNA